jgi:hypothetical protein
MKKAKGFDYKPTDEQYREMENLLKDMVSLIKQGMMGQ